MADPKTKVRLSERFTVQVTPEKMAELLEMAQRQYGGDMQALVRAPLDGWLQREDTRRSYEARILETLDELREETARKKDIYNIIKYIDFMREDFSWGAEINDILDTVKKIRKDNVIRNQMIDHLVEQLGGSRAPSATVAHKLTR